MRELDGLTVHVLVDNVTDMLSSRPLHVTSEMRVLIEAGMAEMTGEALCCAQHGLSLLVTARLGSERRTVLFDAGPNPYALDRNVGRMGLDLGTVDAAVLSHGHFDHSGGLLKAAELIRAGNDGKTVPLHVHPGAFVKRALRLPTGHLVQLQDVVARRALEHGGIEVITSDRPEEILDGSFFLSGEIPRTSFERGFDVQVRMTDAGEWEPDPLVIDERFMLAHVKGKGLAIFTGCSHAGIVNICTHVRELFPDVPLYALVGGLHLALPNEDLIDQTVAELQEFGLKTIIAGHCTGWRAMHALVTAFGDGVVDPLAVGTRQDL